MSIKIVRKEVTTQHLIADGFDIGTSKDPYKNFVYTSYDYVDIIKKLNSPWYI